VLIYTNGSLQQHREQVKKVLARLAEAGLQLDIDKSEFEVCSTKYLGFIIEAGKGIRMDPEKVKAILDWEAPKSVKGVQSFLGFANFYRQFIYNYSAVAMPISSLIRKEGTYQWTSEAQEAFVRMKSLFTTAPMLLQFDSERGTILETDASTWSIGGVLMQYDKNGILRPCAFYSKKNAPAECNYEIYDKEMLAIIRCLEEWDSELRSVKSFEIRTDHKNLKYFMTTRKLTERQMRWSIILSRYNFAISYIKGATNERADALSRREQDAPNGEADNRIQYRTMQLLKPEVLRGIPIGTISVAPVAIREPPLLGEVSPIPAAIEPSVTELKGLWEVARQEDETYGRLVEALQEGKRLFPPALGIRVSIGECTLSEDRQDLLFRGRKWVPDSEPLRTKLIQQVHDSVMAGHPGREVTSALLARLYFWPHMMRDVRQFVRNCDLCCSNKVWRERKQGFLKPLPIPDRIWTEISMDFITDLPESDGCTNLLVVTDRLSKGVILEGMKDITTDALADIFIQSFYRHHGLPKAIVSDRGTQFVSAMWARICKLLGIIRRLSTAFHPETDGSTERMNQTLETYLRIFVNWAQTNWKSWLPLGELAINIRDAASTGVSPFFIMHGYHMNPIEVHEEQLSSEKGDSPIQRADKVVRQLKNVAEWAQASMATAQQIQEETTNRSRQQAPSFSVGDKVWLDLSKIRTNRLSKKLDAKYGKFIIIEVIGSHSFRLNTPPGIHNVFHSNKLRLAATDPLPSQQSTDSQPKPVLVGDDLEYGVEEVLQERIVRKGRGHMKQYLVKWTGYQRPTWERADALENTVALDAYEAR
jgi:transposase InsO family protein